MGYTFGEMVMKVEYVGACVAGVCWPCSSESSADILYPSCAKDGNTRICMNNERRGFDLYPWHSSQFLYGENAVVNTFCLCILLYTPVYTIWQWIKWGWKRLDQD